MTDSPMTTHTLPHAPPRQSYPRHRPPALILLVALILAVTIFSGHALRSHSKDVAAINQCFNSGGTLSQWYQGPDGRWARNCQQGQRSFWRIFDCTSSGDRIVVTQFRQGLRRFARYVRAKEFTVSEPPGCE